MLVLLALLALAATAVLVLDTRAVHAERVRGNEQSMRSDDAREAGQAFREKREPNFTGR